MFHFVIQKPSEVLLDHALWERFFTFATCVLEKKKKPWIKYWYNTKSKCSQFPEGLARNSQISHFVHNSTCRLTTTPSTEAQDRESGCWCLLYLNLDKKQSSYLLLLKKKSVLLTTTTPLHIWLICHLFVVLVSENNRFSWYTIQVSFFITEKKWYRHRRGLLLKRKNFFCPNDKENKVQQVKVVSQSWVKQTWEWTQCSAKKEKTWWEISHSLRLTELLHFSKYTLHIRICHFTFSFISVLKVYRNWCHFHTEQRKFMPDNTQKPGGSVYYTL